ncbi:MAG: hypothetical protein H2057_01080 [Alphaproteobacteria bacterium]|nr:hypothetical protein [Alphaproteobacteria bacterium]
MPEDRTQSKEGQGTIVVDAQADANLIPLQFRTTKDIFLPCFIKKLVKAGKTLPSKKGFEDLNISASAQFSQTSFDTMVKILNPNMYVVDLRLESHGFAGGHAVSLYAPENGINKGLLPTEIEVHEKAFLAELVTNPPEHIYQIVEKGGGRISQTTPVAGSYTPVFSEAELTKERGVRYIRFTTLDHSRPEDAVVDAFVTFVKALEKGTWLHFHCRAGRGRTTQFSVMYDMLQNAKDVSFEDILHRHYLIGGSPLFELDADPDEQWKKQMNQGRLAFLKSFYVYAKDPKGFSNGASWRAWLQAAPEA